MLNNKVLWRSEFFGLAPRIFVLCGVRSALFDCRHFRSPFTEPRGLCSDEGKH